jgi:hypothetical protein
MYKKYVFIFAAILLSSSIYAQKKALDKSASISLAFGDNQFSIASMYQHVWLLGKKKRFGIGAGARLTNSFFKNTNFTTAPAKLTSGKQGPAVFFADDIPQNIDSFALGKAQINSLNLSVNFIYKISNKFTAGFNIDAIGFSFGQKQKGVYIGNGGMATAIAAKPTVFNALLISDNDLGSLNSEFFMQYNVNKNWGAKIGFQFLFGEYTTDANVQTTPTGDKNDRFRVKSSSLSLGAVYNF